MRIVFFIFSKSNWYSKSSLGVKYYSYSVLGFLNALVSNNVNLHVNWALVIGTRKYSNKLYLPVYTTMTLFFNMQKLYHIVL